MRQLLRRLVLLGRGCFESDGLEAEMRFHRDMRAAKLQHQGFGRSEAEIAANRRFGNVTLLKEKSKDMWGWNWLNDLTKDLRYTARMMRSNPLFTLIVILTLALGIGANTAIFSVVNAVLYRNLPVHDPKQIVYLRVEPGQPNRASNTGNGDSSFSEDVFEKLRTRHEAFADLVAYVPIGYNKVALRYGKVPEEVAIDMVSGNFFSGLGVSTVCGRPLSIRDEKEHAAVVVLSYGFWNRRFAGNCSVIGQTVYIKSLPFTVIGVAGQRFYGVESNATDAWIPLQLRPELNAWGSQGGSYYTEKTWWCLPLMARLAPGVTQERAAAMLEAPFRQAAYDPFGGKPEKGELPPKLTFVQARGMADARDAYEKPLWVLFSMVGAVLVICCGNVALLLVARNAAREKEFSIRLAIGGSRSRLFRQLLAESLALVSSGTTLGWLLAIAGTRALAVSTGTEISLSPDRTVLLFTIGIAAFAGLIFGIAPLFSAVNAPLEQSLRGSSGRSSPDRTKVRGGKFLVALQIALCLTLAVGAGLLVQTLRNLENQNLGFRTEGLLVFGIEPQLKTHSDPEAIRFYQTLVEKLRSIGGVEAVTLMQNRIGSGWSNNTSAILDGKNPSELSSGIDSNVMRWNAVGPNYFATLGIRIKTGRDFNDSDSYAGPKAAVVNQTFADKFLNGRIALGHQVSFTSKISYTIVGVAADSKYTGVKEQDTPMAYFPYTQIPDVGNLHVELQTIGDPVTFLSAARKVVAQLAPDAALLQPMSQKAQFEDSISEDRLVAKLAILFGVLAAVLVATGLYGTLAFNVARRTPELGIRFAIGAQRDKVIWMILRESLTICAVGICVGLPLAWFAVRLMGSLLYGLAPHDPLTICLATLGIVAVSTAASLVPALRAASVDPIRALRYE